jgi:hypothetical protein
MAQDTADDGAPALASLPTPGDLRASVAASDDGESAGDALTTALGRIDGLADAPLTEHVDVFDAVHEALQERLADAED